jgi:hypothetical protein
MVPQVGCVNTFKIAKGRKFFPKAFVCQDSCLWESPNGLEHLNVYILYACLRRLYCLMVQLEKQSKGVCMYLKYSRVAVRCKNFISRHMYRALSMLTTLFQ